MGLFFWYDRITKGGISMKFEIVQTPLLSLSAEAVVNRANIGLQYASGLCGEIFDAAGKIPLQRALCAIGTCSVGHAVVTSGFSLPSRFIIHAVPPCWCGGKHGEDKILAQCDRNVLALAERLKVHSLALPLLSRDRFEYPEELDLQIAEAPML